MTAKKRYRSWDERNPLAEPDPEQQWVETEAKKRRRKVHVPAEPIEPKPEAIELMTAALAQLERAHGILDRAKRDREANGLRTTINDLQYRLIPYANLVACTDCGGYQRGGPQTCAHPWNQPHLAVAD